MIKEHAVAVALAMREKGAADNDLFDRLAADGRLGLSRAEIDALVADRAAFVGAASGPGATCGRPTRSRRAMVAAAAAIAGRGTRPRRDPARVRATGLRPAAAGSTAAFAR